MTLPPRRWIWIALAALLATAAAGAAWWRFGQAQPVRLATVAEGPVALRVVGPGLLQARVPVTVASRVTSTVRTVQADVGDLVQAGQTLATLDDRDLAARRDAVAGQRQALARQVEAAEATRARAQADLALARSRRQRDAELQARGFVSEAGLEGSATALAAAQAGLDGAEATLAARRAELASSAHELAAAEAARAHTVLRAPADAVVIQRLAEPGSTVVPGTPVLKLVDPATVWVAMRVDETMLAALQPGQPAQIRLRSGAVASGRVARIAMQSDAATREIDVHISFDQVPASFAIDQQAEVTVEAGQERGLRLPVSALRRDADGRSGVLAVRDGRARFVPVRTGLSDGEHLLVQQGLANGEQVVAPAAGVRDGARVRAAEAG